MTTTILGFERDVFLSIILFYLFEFLHVTVATVISPSVIFYIESVGGTPKDFGVATSLINFGGTLMMAVIGLWMDRNGNKYRAPYMFVILIGILGSLIYFLASFLPSGFWAVHAILIGFCLMGTGSAVDVITASWIATVVPMDRHKLYYTIVLV